MNKKLKDVLLVVILTIFLTIIAVVAILLFYAMSHNAKVEPPLTKETEEELLLLLNSKNVAIEKADLRETEETDQILEDEETPAEEEIEIITSQAVMLKDIYTEKGVTAFFKCYDKDAIAYGWEYYDIPEKKWVEADNASIHSYTDELGRDVSMLEVGTDESNDGLMVRCTIGFQGKEAEHQTASLHIIRKIKNISIEDIETDANRYFGTDELPVTVTYEDGGEESITGLGGLYFIAMEEETDYGASVSGNQIETTTIVRTECEYLNTGLDKKETLVRYRPRLTEKIETTCSITGNDIKAPEISDVKTSPYEISNIDQPVDLNITITAEDDATPYPELEYAFIYYDQELSEADWGNKPSFDVCIERNGTYSAYARDQSGNIGKYDIEITTVDTKAPVILSVSLSNEEDWCKSNTILVKAKDAGEISYCYENKSDGTSSGWITYNNYTADSNGTWIIKAKDAVGNISETEITISNIDNEAPSIKKISVK